MWVFVIISENKIKKLQNDLEKANIKGFEETITSKINVLEDVVSKTSALPNTIEQRITILESRLEDIENGKYNLISPVEALKDYFKVSDEESVKKAKNGMKISYRYIKELYQEIPNRFAIVNDNQLIAIYKLEYSDELKTYFYKADTVWN